MLKEKIHNYMPYIGVALQVVSNYMETFICHLKKNFMPLDPFLFNLNEVIVKSGILVHKVK